MTSQTQPPQVFLGTGGYSDPTLYPPKLQKASYLQAYAQRYSAVEINSSFYAPLGAAAFAGMLDKSARRLQFAIKLHQDFSHARKATAKHAQAFLQAIAPIHDAKRLAALLLQLPHGFDRTVQNRRYLDRVCHWFADMPLTIEFRHPSWHTAQVEASFRSRQLIWCSVDYPKVSGLPAAKLLFTQSTTLRTGYLRLHGHNPNWWDAPSAAARHDYRYSQDQMQAWAQTIADQSIYFDRLFVFFQNTTKAHAVYNLAMLADALKQLGLDVPGQFELPSYLTDDGDLLSHL